MTLNPKSTLMLKVTWWLSFTWQPVIARCYAHETDKTMIATWPLCLVRIYLHVMLWTNTRWDQVTWPHCNVEQPLRDWIDWVFIKGIGPSNKYWTTSIYDWMLASGYWFMVCKTGKYPIFQIVANLYTTKPISIENRLYNHLLIHDNDPHKNTSALRVWPITSLQNRYLIQQQEKCFILIIETPKYH